MILVWKTTRMAYLIWDGAPGGRTLRLPCDMHTVLARGCSPPVQVIASLFLPTDPIARALDHVRQTMASTPYSNEAVAHLVEKALLGTRE